MVRHTPQILTIQRIAKNEPTASRPAGKRTTVKTRHASSLGAGLDLEKEDLMSTFIFPSSLTPYPTGQ